MRSSSPQPDHRIIVDLVRERASALDLGCGSGDLLFALMREKGVRAQGIEIDDRAIYECVAKGLSVFHGDIDTGLSEYGDKSFDYVILNQTLQQVRQPDVVLREALRVGREVIVGFPNFAHCTVRLQILLRGRTPVTPALPYEWHDTPNLHFLSISDFIEYCRQREIHIRRSAFVANGRRLRVFPNLLAQIGIFLIARNEVEDGHGASAGECA